MMDFPAFSERGGFTTEYILSIVHIDDRKCFIGREFSRTINPDGSRRLKCRNQSFNFSNRQDSHDLSKISVMSSTIATVVFAADIKGMIRLTKRFFKRSFRLIFDGIDAEADGDG